MTRTNFSRLLAVCLALSLSLVTTKVRGQSESEEETPALKAGKSVRHKVLYRASRFEVTPGIGVTTGDSYMRNAVVGLNGAYYLNNVLGLGFSAGYSPLHTETDLAKNTKKALDANDPSKLEQLTFSYMQWFAGFDIVYVPIFGKFSLMNETSMNYDLHLIGGAAVIGRQACSASTVGKNCATTNANPSDDDVGGLRPAGTVGAGFRMFFGDAYALNLEVRDHLYQRVKTSTGSGKADLTSNVYLSIGFSLFFPQTVKISR